MKKNLAKKVTLSILAGAVLMSSSVVWGANAPTNWVSVSYGSILPAFYHPGTSGSNIISSGEYNVVLAGVAIVGNSGDASSLKAATGGNLIIKGGNFSGKAVYGGAGVYETSMAGQEYAKVNNNTITIDGGSFEPAYISQGMQIIGGWASISGIATNNHVIINDLNLIKVNISGEDVEGIKEVVGGYATGLSEGSFNGGEANNNTVTINGGIFKDVNDRNTDIIGGFGRFKAQDNTVTISGTANIEKANLFGGYLKVSDSKYNFDYTGNTLNFGTDSAPWQATVTGKAGGNKVQNKVRRIAGFDVINFNNIAWEKDGTVVEATDLTLNKTKITANIKSGTLTEATEMMNLIKTENAIVGSIASTGNTVNVGIAESYTGAITQEDKAIVITLTGTPSCSDPEEGGNTGNDTPSGGETGGESGGTTPQPERNDQVLVIGESRAAAVAFTNQGSELIETGLNALARDNEKDTKVFAAVYGNHSEYETGSHVNVNGWSGIVGVGKTNDKGLTVGAFFENGEGNYSTHNLTDFGYLRGDGEAVYNGGGFLVRKDNANGVYTEAAIRAGNLQNELRDAVIGSTGAMGYDIDTFYYGVQVGVGKIIPRGNDGDSIDVYGKFIYTHHDSEDFTIDGDDFHFDSVDSERLRLGFRINEVQTNKLAMYYGAAWEYEFGGDADNTVVGYDLSTPSLGGSTVIGEIGAHYKASEKWSIDLNGRAYVGQREGFSGSVQANYNF